MLFYKFALKILFTASSCLSRWERCLSEAKTERVVADPTPSQPPAAAALPAGEPRPSPPGQCHQLKRVGQESAVPNRELLSRSLDKIRFCFLFVLDEILKLMTLPSGEGGPKGRMRVGEHYRRCYADIQCFSSLISHGFAVPASPRGSQILAYANTYNSASFKSAFY